jgi:hypothetical protein
VSQTELFLAIIGLMVVEVYHLKWIWWEHMGVPELRHPEQELLLRPAPQVVQIPLTPPVCLMRHVGIEAGCR